MRHNISVFNKREKYSTRRREAEYSECWYTFLVIPSTILAIFGFPAATMSSLAFLVLFIPLLTIFFLTITGETFLMGTGRAYYWNIYRSLSKENQSAINLNRKWFIDLPSGKEWEGLQKQLMNLRDLEKENKTLRDTQSGRGRETFTNLKEAIENERREREVLIEVNDKMKELQ